MNASFEQTWFELNQDYLSAALRQVQRLLETHIARPQAGPEPSAVGDRQPISVKGMPGPAALETLCTLFGLSSFERDILLMCAGMELDSAFPAVVARAHGNATRDRPDFSLALAAFPQAHWSALNPGAPLRLWRLIEVGAGATMVTSPLRIDERILHFLIGVQHLDEHLIGFVRPVIESNSNALVLSHVSLAEQIAISWSRNFNSKPLPAIQLCGQEAAGKRAIAAATAKRLGLNLFEISSHVLPTAPNDLEVFIRLWEREAALSNSALLLDCDDGELADTAREDLIRRFIERVHSALLIASRKHRMVRRRSFIRYDVDKPTSGEQQILWEKALGSATANLNSHVRRLVSQFHLDQPSIQAAYNRAVGQAVASESADNVSADLGDLLWEACRAQARPHLDGLAQRIQPVAAWEDLVLPEPQRQTLKDIAIHVRQRSKVYDTWGFAAKSNRGLGISALFFGPSGTGKTMAAEILANELRLDLYRIDLSQIVNKYIGETEKNLRRVFDAAESGGAILLFDEADALFGKRSEVKDSHDRYANIEVSYLLQRMEAYRGLAILTTNMKSALDDAFLRRIRFMIQFPFPDRAQRAAIWEHIYPSETPTEGLDWSRLAQLNVAGGNIRNIALHAAFLAAEANQPVRMEYVLQAARIEYAKLEKPLTAGETRGWEAR